MRVLVPFLMLMAVASAQQASVQQPSVQQAPVQQVSAQQPAQSPPQAQTGDNEVSGKRQMTVPAGTQVLLYLKSPINTKNAKVGDGVYCQTSFPVTQDNIVVIPAGTYVKGQIAEVQRAGRIKGRALVLFHFTSMIFPSGYTVDLPGALKSQPGATNSTVSDDEGTVKANSQKGKDAGTVAGTAATGAVVGTVATGTARGAGFGGLTGAAIGLGQVLFTRGQDVRIDQGTALEMVLQRPLTVEITRPLDSDAHADNNVVPQPGPNNRLTVPSVPK